MEEALLEEALDWSYIASHASWMLILTSVPLYVYTAEVSASPFSLAAVSNPRGAFLRHRSFPARSYSVTISFACLCVNVRARECSENVVL